MVEATVHHVQVLSIQPWIAVLPPSLIECSPSSRMDLEYWKRFIERGKCPKGHKIMVTLCLAK
jgi:hypothetical protein